MITVENLIAMAEQIAAEDPAYKQGQDGRNGECDCIGMIIGAIRRAGGQWRGLHGSNYAARYETKDLKKLNGTGDLVPGEVVYKAYTPGQGGYNLPGRYEHGGEYYTGDLNDYYHVGIVESVYPLRIRHMTSPKARMDTSIGKWQYHGRLKKVDYTGRKTMETVTISGGNPDAPIRMRKSASKAGAVIAEIPQGSKVDLIEGGGVWNQIRFNGLDGYVMAEFVHRDEEEAITVNKKDLEKAYDLLGNLLGLRG